MQLDFQARELTVKLVYCGPALSGKTTNLQAIHRVARPEAAGRLMSLDTRDDRTLFFDLLPLTFSAGSGVSVRIKVFTVPGQAIHNATRRLVLQGVDGVAFVADSQRRETQSNRQAFLNMQDNLRDNGMDPASVPMVIQFNKRDLPDIRTDEEIDSIASKGREPVFKAVATRGIGVIETFLGLAELTWDRLERDHSLSAKFEIRRADLFESIRQNLVGREEPSAPSGTEH